MKKQTIKKILYYFGKNKFLFALSVLLILIGVISTLYIPIIAGDAIDSIKENGTEFDVIKNYLIKILILALIYGVVQWISGIINNHIIFNAVRNIRNDLFRKIQKLPVNYFDTNTSGDTVSRIINDSENFADGLLLGFARFVTGISTIIGTLIFMLKLNAKITPLVIVLTPLSLFVAKFVASHSRDKFVEKSKATGSLTSFIGESVSGRKVISSYNFEESSKEKFDELNEKYYSSSLKAIFYSSITNPSTRFVNNLIYAVVALTGAFCAVSGTITIGGLTCFLNYAGQYAKPFNEISEVIAELQSSLASAERIFSLFEKKEIEEENGTTEIKGNVNFSSVSFSYDSSKKILSNIDFSAKEGNHIAIVGPTGCGKTTLINLLMRFYDAEEGIISLEDVDIKTISRKHIRLNIGMVLQDTWLKEGTIRDNIAFGKPDATDEEIINAAKSAHAHSFIKRLANGYDTKVSNDFSGISAGQKQLICIARLMLSLPPVLILDEATSSIDTRTELKIRAAFSEMMKGRTSFIVAHRLSTIKNSDLILVLKDGVLIEKGTHKELLEAKGFYYELYNSRIS